MANAKKNPQETAEERNARWNEEAARTGTPVDEIQRREEESAAQEKGNGGDYNHNA